MLRQPVLLLLLLLPLHRMPHLQQPLVFVQHACRGRRRQLQERTCTQPCLLGRARVCVWCVCVCVCVCVCA